MNQILSRRDFVRGGLMAAAWSFCAGGSLVSAQLRAAVPEPKIHRLAKWRSAAGVKHFTKAFEFLESGKLTDLQAGRYPVDGERMYVVIAQDQTRPVDTAQFEVHHKYIDLHYLIRGRELIGSAPVSKLQEAKVYNPEVEAALYDRPRKYKRFIMQPGEFVVFFPGQAHMPGCSIGENAEIKKAVVKILAEGA